MAYLLGQVTVPAVTAASSRPAEMAIVWSRDWPILGIIAIGLYLATRR